jgi:hypothetical protein
MLEVVLLAFLGNGICFGLAFGFAALDKYFQKGSGKNE